MGTAAKDTIVTTVTPTEHFNTASKSMTIKDEYSPQEITMANGVKASVDWTFNAADIRGNGQYEPVNMKIRDKSGNVYEYEPVRTKGVETFDGTTPQSYKFEPVSVNGVFKGDDLIYGGALINERNGMPDKTMTQEQYDKSIKQAGELLQGLSDTGLFKEQNLSITVAENTGRDVPRGNTLHYAFLGPEKGGGIAP